MLKIDKETLDKWININNLSYLEISRRLQCSNTYVKKYALKLGIILPKRTSSRSVSWNKGKGKVYIYVKIVVKKLRILKVFIENFVVLNAVGNILQK